MPIAGRKKAAWAITGGAFRNCRRGAIPLHHFGRGRRLSNGGGPLIVRHRQLRRRPNRTTMMTIELRAEAATKLAR
jgi:hypothetical protein